MYFGERLNLATAVHIVRGMAGKDAQYISIAGQQPTVTLVNNGANRPPAVTRQVLVTPLTSPHTIQQQRNFAATKSLQLNSQPSSHTVSKVDKVLLKAVNKKGKKDPKTFTLRNIDQHALLTCDNLKGAIRRKLSDDITTGDFDVGYVQGTTVVRIRTSDDLEELWSLLRQPQKKHSSVVRWVDCTCWTQAQA